MLKTLIITLIIQICILWGEAKVEKVLETKSISEYNLWVKANKIKYPLLQPYIVRTEDLNAYYYDSDGRLIKEITLKAKKGWGMHLISFPYAGKIMSVEYDLSQDESSPSIHSIIEDDERLWSFTWSNHYPTHAGVMFLPNDLGIFRSQPYSNNPGNCYAELLSWDGKKMARIESLCTINIESVATPDGKYIILNGDHTLHLLKDNHVLWRKSFSSSFKVSISNDGKYICVGDSCAISIYDQQGTQLYSYVFSPRQSEIPYSRFSSDNQYLSAATSKKLMLMNNRTGELIWEKYVDGDNFKRHLFFINEYIVLTHTSKAELYLYDLKGDLLETINVSSLYCSVVDDFIIINAEGDDFVLVNEKEKRFHKIIYRIK